MIKTDDKRWGSFYILFAAIYFTFTSFIIGHGIHITNLIISISLLVIGAYSHIKKNNWMWVMNFNEWKIEVRFDSDEISLKQITPTIKAAGFEAIKKEE